MGIITRFFAALEAAISRLFEVTEDPRETLDVAYQRQLEHLHRVKLGLVDVTTARRRLELQATGLHQNTQRLDDQARRALAAGREDLARLALQRKQVALQQLESLDQQLAGLSDQQEQLSRTERELASRVDAFRTQKEVMKAQYSAAEAQVRIRESLSGLAEDVSDVGRAVERVRERTAALQARAGAIDELVAAGTLEDLSGGQDIVERELARLTVTQRAEEELAQLKAETSGQQPALDEKPKSIGRGGQETQERQLGSGS